MAAAGIGRVANNGRVGVVAALNWEAAAFSERRAPGSNLLVESTGPGPGPAAEGAERLLERGASILLSWGSAGALGCAGPGDIVLPYRVHDATRREFEVDRDLSDRLVSACEGIAPLHRGNLASVEAPVITVSAKRALAESTGALAVDMESAAIARVAAAARVPFIAIRVILDTARRAVPAAAIAGMDGPRTRPVRVLAGLLRSPADTGGLIALGFAAHRARRTLAACALKLPEALRVD